MTVTTSEPIIQYLFRRQVSGHSPHHLPEALPWSTASHTLLNLLWWWASNSLVQNTFHSLCKCNTNVMRIKQTFVGLMAKDCFETASCWMFSYLPYCHMWCKRAKVHDEHTSRQNEVPTRYRIQALRVVTPSSRVFITGSLKKCTYVGW